MTFRTFARYRCDDGATVSREKSVQAFPPIFLQSCETQSGTESLGSRLVEEGQLRRPAVCTVTSYSATGMRLARQNYQLHASMCLYITAHYLWLGEVELQHLELVGSALRDVTDVT